MYKYDQKDYIDMWNLLDRLNSLIYLFELGVFKTHMSDKNSILKCLNFQIVFKKYG